MCTPKGHQHQAHKHLSKGISKKKNATTLGGGAQITITPNPTPATPTHTHTHKHQDTTHHNTRAPQPGKGEFQNIRCTHKLGGPKSKKAEPSPKKQNLLNSNNTNNYPNNSNTNERSTTWCENIQQDTTTSTTTWMTNQTNTQTNGQQPYDVRHETNNTRRQT